MQRCLTWWLTLVVDFGELLGAAELGRDGGLAVAALVEAPESARGRVPRWVVRRVAGPPVGRRPWALLPPRLLLREELRLLRHLPHAEFVYQVHVGELGHFAGLARGASGARSLGAGLGLRVERDEVVVRQRRLTGFLRGREICLGVCMPLQCVRAECAGRDRVVQQRARER